MNVFTKTAACLALAVLAATTAQTQEPPVFQTLEQEMRFAELTEELRCTVCQNQNLADSDAQLARDLRQEIQEMILAGRSDEQIKTFLVDRYGDFVLYRPPVQGNTLALWAIPVVLLLVGAVAVFFVVRNRNKRLAEQRQAGNS